MEEQPVFCYGGFNTFQFLLLLRKPVISICFYLFLQ